MGYYYVLKCNQNQVYMHTGFNSTSLDELKTRIINYLCADEDYDSDLERYLYSLPLEVLLAENQFDYEVYNNKQVPKEYGLHI